MTSVYLVDGASPLTADAVVVATVSTGYGVALADGAAGVDAALGGRLLPALRAVEATGRADEAIKIPTLGKGDTPLVVAAGLGPGSPASSTPKRSGARWERALRGLQSAGRVAVAIG